MDAATTVRDRYIPKRAREVAYSRAADIIQRELEKARQMVAGLTEVAQRVKADATAASAAAEALRDVAKDIEIDVSDETLKEPLSRAVEVETRQVFENLGFKVQEGPPKAVPTRGTLAEKPRRAAPPPAAPTEPQEAPAEPTEAPAAPPAPPPPPAAPGAAQAAPQGGRVSTVTPRARRALRAVAGGAKDGQGVTHRAEAMVDPETGARIPVSEQIVVDDAPPEPGAHDPEDKGTSVRTHAEEPD